MTVDELTAALTSELGGEVGIERRHLGGDVWDLYVAPPRRSPAFALLSFVDGGDDVRIIYSEGEQIVGVPEALALLRTWAERDLP